MSALLRGIFAAVLFCFCSPVLAVGEVGPTIILGGPGGASFTDQCKDGYYLWGFAAQGTKDLNQIRGVCRRFNTAGNSQAERYELSTWGKPGEGAFNYAESASTCPENAAVEKVTVETSRVNLVHRFKFVCRYLPVYDHAETEWSATLAGVGLAPQTAGCGGGAIAVGLIGRQGSNIDALGLLCKVLVSAAPPPPNTAPPPPPPKTAPPPKPPITVNNGNGDQNNGDGNDNDPPPKNGGSQSSAANDTTIYDQPEGNDVAYLTAGDPVTIVNCNDNNWCQISKPRRGWVWGDDLNH